MSRARVFAPASVTGALPPAASAVRSASGVRTTVLTAAVLAAAVVLAAGLRLVSVHGLWGADDAEYALLANAMATGNYWSFVDANYVREFNAPAHLPYRTGLIAPLALLFGVFGVSEAALIAYPLLISVLGVLLAFACARHFFGANAGLVAAALWAVVPVDVKYATSFLPDGIASFYASLAVLTVLVLEKREHATTRGLFAGGVAAGLLFGVSWLSKESVTYLAPFCAILIVSGLRRDAKRTTALWLGVAFASGAVVAAEMAYYALVRGDFMLRMHENERSFLQTRSYLFYEGSRFGWPVGGDRTAALIKRLFVSGPDVFFLDSRFLFLPLIGVVAAARAWFWKDSAFKVPALWMLTLIAMYNFASPSLETYTPLVLLHRYLIPIVLPAVVLTAGLLVRLLERRRGEAGSDARERMFWGAAVAGALLVIASQVTLRDVRGLAQIQPMYELRQAAALAGPQDVVYTDPLTRKSLEFHWKYPSATRIVDFEGLGDGAIEPGSFVLVDTHRLNWLDVNVSMWLTEDYGYHEPSFSKTPPASWVPVWRNQYTTLYRVGRREPLGP